MRIGIVNDLKIVVEHLKIIVTKKDLYEVAWVAYNGEEAVKKCAADTPDLILMDLIMPVMDGVEATAVIMKNTPCAILIVTSSVGINVSLTFYAMGHGALDVVRTPGGQSPEEESALLRKIEVICSYIGKSKQKIVEVNPQLAFFDKPAVVPPLLVIGASTGGPAALVKLFSSFSYPFEFACVVIQHINQEFAPGLAKWLGDQIDLPVDLVVEGHGPEKGKILIAGRNQHLELTADGQFIYLPLSNDNSYCPSIDIFFQSVADIWPGSSIAVLLTGMGYDGARGLKALHEKGWYTIAQSRESCIVYGMPKIAIELGAADLVASPEKMYEAIKDFLNKGRAYE